MKINFRHDYVIATMVVLGVGGLLALGSYATRQVENGLKVADSRYAEPDAFPANQPTPTAPPDPTVLAATPTPTPVVPTLIGCAVIGQVYQMTPAECDEAKRLAKQIDDSLANYRQPAPTWVTLDYQIPSPPTGVPLLPTSTPVPCDLSAKARLDATYQQDMQALEREYRQTLGQIQASGASDSSATQAAHSAYVSQLNQLKSRYQSSLQAINCS